MSKRRETDRIEKEWRELDKNNSGGRKRKLGSKESRKKESDCSERNKC